MKQGRTLTELAAEIERQHLTKKDYVAGTTSMVVHAPLNEATAKREGASSASGWRSWPPPRTTRSPARSTR